jgi:uncharacterized membrane protein
LLNITLFSRKECHLCDQAIEDLESLQERYPHNLAIIDIDDQPELEAAYGFAIPVIEVGPYTLKAPFDKQKLMITLGAAQDRVEQLEEDQGFQKAVERGQKISKADRFAMWFSKRYMLIFNLFVFIYVGLPFLAPVLLRSGAQTPANIIYRVYGGLCHQLSYRSFFLFGEQPIYPRATAGVEGFETFNQATGLDEEGILAARAFRGDETTGYKIGLCQRDVAIYGVILAFGVVFTVTGKKIRPLPLWIWLLFGILPIGLDGGTQLVGMFVAQFDAPFWQTLSLAFPPRESIPFLRVLTGGLFGLTTAWFGYPLVEETMQETRLMLTKKIAHIDKSKA